MKITSLFVFLLTCLVFSSATYGNEARMTLANHSDDLRYTVTLEFNDNIYIQHVEPKTRIRLEDIVGDMDYAEIPQHVGMTVSASVNGENYTHRRAFVDKDTFIALYNLRQPDGTFFHNELEPDYAFPYSFLTKQGEVFSEQGHYPNYTVYFNHNISKLSSDA